MFVCSEVELNNIINGTMDLKLSVIIHILSLLNITVKGRVPNATKLEFNISPIICNQTHP